MFGENPVWKPRPHAGANSIALNDTRLIRHCFDNENSLRKPRGGIFLYKGDLSFAFVTSISVIRFNRLLACCVVFRCNLKLLKPIFFLELILVCGSEVTKKFSVRVCERDDNTDPTLSSNEREGLICLSPPMRGIRRRRHKQRVEAEKNFEFSLSFIFSFFL